jgi:cysteine/histidine-rich domain-containing protein 1
LNIKGCTRSKHSNVKPPEPEKPIKQDVDVNEVIEVKPIVPVTKERPPFDSPMVLLIHICLNNCVKAEVYYRPQ